MAVRLSLSNICVIWGSYQRGRVDCDHQWSESGIIMKYYPLISVKYAPAWSALPACLHTILITRKNVKITLIFSRWYKVIRVWGVSWDKIPHFRDNYTRKLADNRRSMDVSQTQFWSPWYWSRLVCVCLSLWLLWPTIQGSCQRCACYA